jgi:hypothetical protein
MRAEFAEVRGEMDARFDKVDERFDKVDERFDKVDARFERINENFQRLDMLLLAFHGVLVKTCVFAVGLLAVLVTVIGIQA